MSSPRFSIIRDFIKEYIARGEWTPGTRVPSENELGEQFKVSRMTARRALDELTREGLVKRIRGSGTFVADKRPESSLLTIRNIAEEIAGRGHRHLAKVILLEPRKADASLGLSFEMKPGSSLYYSLIVHFENDQAVQQEARYVNPRFAPAYLEQDFVDHTPNVYLMDTAPLTEADHLVAAVLPDKESARRLGIAANEPCLQLTRKSWCSQGVVSHAVLLHPGKRYRLGDHLKFSED